MERWRRPIFFRERRDHVARIFLAFDLLGLGHHAPRKMRFKLELRLATLCHRKGRLSSDIHYVLTTQ